MAVRLVSARQIEVEGLKFSIRPESYAGFIAAWDRAEKMFPVPLSAEPGKEKATDQGDDSGLFRTLASVHFNLMDRIDAWEGIELENGEPAPCTMDMKLHLFGVRPDLLRKISDKLKGVDDTEQKKSEPSRDG